MKTHFLSLQLLLFALLLCGALGNPKPSSKRWLDRVAKRRAPGCSVGPRACQNRAAGFPHLKCCAARCVDVKRDESNCGRCGKKCPFSWRCCNGKCVDPRSNALHCGGCNCRCAAGSGCAYGMCGYGAPPTPRRGRLRRRGHRRHRRSRS